MNKHIVQGYQMVIHGKKINKCITLMKERMFSDGRAYFARNGSYHLKAGLKKRVKHYWIKIKNRRLANKKRARLAQLAER